MIHKYIIKSIVKNIYKIILLSYLIMFSRLFEVCYKINNFNYGVIIILYLLALLLYWFYVEILKGFTYKLFFTGTVLTVLLILSLYNIFNPYSIIYNSAVNIRNVYLETLLIDFKILIPFLIIVIPMFIAIIFSLKDKIPFITLLLTLPMMYLLWYNDCSIKLYTNIYIILCCFDLGINIHNLSLRKARNNNYKILIPSNNMVYIAIMVTLIATFTAFAGETFGVKSIEQIKNDRMRTKINEANSSSNMYGLNNSGYGSNSSILGGEVELNYNLALKVKSSKPMYLRGNVLDYYSGFGWSKPEDSYYFFDSKSTRKVAKSEKIEVSPQTLITSTFLAPLNTFNVIYENGNILYNNSKVFIIGDKSNVILPYTIEYDLTQHENTNNASTFNKVDNEKYKKYLQLPNNITIETYNLVKGLLKDCKSSKEKIDKINKYLLENYKYSLKVDTVPKGREFLDYFLFEEKKGYCTYFATAATIFARIAGIPARYVEGFSMDNTKDSNGVYLVGNNRAHAWSEILISPSEDLWETLESTPTSSQGEKEYEIIFPKTNSNGEVFNYDETEWAKTDNKFKIPIINIPYVLIIYFISFGLILIVLVVFFIRLKKYIKNKERILCCNGVIPIYYYSKKRLSSIGIKWSDSLSDKEGALGLKDEVLRQHFINLVEVFYEEYYADNVDTSYNKLEFYKYLEGYVRKNSHIFKYYYNRFK